MFLIKIGSYLVSLFPLILILLVQQNIDFYKGNYSILSLVIWLYLAVILFTSLKLISKMRIEWIPVKLLSIKKKNWEQLTYFMTYIIPFITLDITKLWQLIALCLIIVCIWFLYIKTNLYLSNPMLSSIGINFYIWKIVIDGKEIESVILSWKTYKDLMQNPSVKWDYILEDEAVLILK